MLSVKNSGGGSEVLAGIRIGTAPTKTSYKAGETLDLTGMVVQSITSDGDSETYADVTGWTSDPAEGTVLYESTGSFTISWTFNGKTYVATQAITVQRVLTSIEFTSLPTKTKYSQGDTLDMSGAVIKATFTSGRTENVTPSYSPANGSVLSSYGDTIVTASYTENGTTKTATTMITLPGKIFGVKWTYSNSSPALTRLTSSNDSIVNTDIATSPSSAIGSTGGSSPFDTELPWSGMDEYNVSGGVITYKRGNANFSRANDTVVKIPKFYYKVVDDSSSNTRSFYISPEAADGFTIHPAFLRAGVEKDAIYVARYTTISEYASKTGSVPLVSITRAAARTGSSGHGSNWCQWDYATWCAIWILYLVEYASWDSQSMIGQGYTNNTVSSGQVSGGTDSMTYFTGRAAGTDGWTAVQYRHIENLWGNVYQWVDGINFSDSTIYTCTDPSKFADDTSTNYTNIGSKVASDGYISKLNYLSSAPYAFAPGEASGSTTTFIPDYYTQSTGWHVLYVGGRWGDALFAGLFYFASNNSSSGANSNFGSRMNLIP